MVLCTDEDECASGREGICNAGYYESEALKHALARVRRYGSAAGQSVHIMATNAPCATYKMYACGDTMVMGGWVIGE